MKKMTFSLLFVFTLIFGIVGISAAQIEPPIAPPIWEMDGLRIEYQYVDVTIENQVATTHIDQLFVNDNDWLLEGTYLFPLPDGAAVSQLTMWVDGQPIEAKILEQGEARQIYDEIVRQLRDPALLEYVGTRAIQANVFPIPPNDERRIEIEYSQILPADNGLVHYSFPQSTDLYSNAPLDNQRIRAEVHSNEEMRTIYSPSHAVDIVHDGRYHAIIGYEDSNVLADNDYELYYSVSPDEIGLNLLSYKESGQDGFFTLLVAPPVESETIIAKDVILVVDTSGSMEGEKMVQAQEAAQYVADHLNPDDRFNIVSFSTGTRSFARALVGAGESDGRSTHTQFINNLSAIGGTNISQALLEAAAMAGSERPTTIIFITDGLATEGIVDTPLLLDAVAQAMPADARIFVFGVGNDVDPILLDGLSQAHRGTSSYVRPGESINEEVSAFYAKVSAPVLTNITLDFDEIMVEQQYPSALPDLFAGQQLVLTGRYRDGGAATITLSGKVNGETRTFVYEDNSFRNSGGDAFIPRLWATRAIGHLLTQIRLHGESEELVQSVINLSVRYGIITPYTSYLIEEDDIFSQSGRNTLMDDELSAEFEEETAEGAVAEAAMSADMSDAAAPMAAPRVMATAPAVGKMVEGEDAVDGAFSGGREVNAIQYVGSKTFILKNNVWMDTSFDADSQTPQMVTFASDTYFALLDSAPEVGQYLALGDQVLLVYGGQVYQVTPDGEEGEIVLPDVATTAVATTADSPVEATPADTTSASDGRESVTPEPTTTDNRTPRETTAASGLCSSAAALPLLFGVLGFWGKKKRK